MATLQELTVVVGAQISGFSAAMKEVTDSLGGLGETATASLEHFDGIIEGIGEIAAAAGIATGAFEIAKEALENFSRAEDVRSSFELLTGSTTAAGLAFDGLKDTAIKLAVPFDDLINVAQRLSPEFGVGTQRMQDVLVAAGDAAAALHTNFDTVASAIERVGLTGTITSRQLAALHIDIGDLATAAGTSVTDAIARIKKGGQDAQADVDLLLTAIETKFGGAAEVIASNLSGQMKNLKNELGFISDDLGSALAPLAEDLIAGLKDIEPFLKEIISDGVVPLVQGVEGLIAIIKTIDLGAFGAIGDIFGPIIGDVEELGKNISSLVKQSGLADWFKEQVQSSHDLDSAIGGVVDSIQAKLNAIHPGFQWSDLIPGIGAFKGALESLNDALGLWNGRVTAMKDGQDALTKAMAASRQAADPWNTTAMQLAESQMAADKASRGHGSSVDALTQAYKDLGVKVPPTAAEIDKVASAFELIQAKYTAGLIPLSQYDAAIESFTKKMTSLEGAFKPDVFPVDTLGQALKAAGIQGAEEQIEKLQAGVEAAGDAFTLGRLPASAYADELNKLWAAEDKNSTDGIPGLRTALALAEQDFILFGDTPKALQQALDNLVQAGPAFQDAIGKNDAAIAGLNVSMETVTATAPSVDQILRSFGIETADDVKAHIKSLQDQLDAANQAMSLGVPGAALAAQAALQGLRGEQEKFSKTALDDKALGIPNLQTLKDRLGDAQRAYKNLSDNGLLTSTTNLEGLIAKQQLEIQIAQQQGQNTDNLQLSVFHLSEKLKDQNDGWTSTITNMHNVVNSDVTKTFDDLISGTGTLSQNLTKLGTDFVDTFVNHIIKLALQPALDAMDGLILKLGNFISQITGLGSNSGVLGTAAGLIGKATNIGASGTGAIGDIVSNGDTLAGVGVTAGSSTGALGSLGSIAGIAGAIGSIGSMISGIIGNFQSAKQETSLNAIELNTRITALAMEGNWQSGADTETVFAFSKATMQYASHLVPMHGALDQINGHIIDAVTYLSQAAGGTSVASAITAAQGGSTDTLVQYITGMWSALHTDLVNIWANVQGAGAHLQWIADHIQGTVGGGVTLTSANGGLVASGTVDPNQQLPGLVAFIDGINEKIAAGAINQTGDVQSTTDLLTTISATLKTTAQTVANGFTGSLSGLSSLLNAAGQSLPRLDNLVANSAAFLKMQPAVNVYVTVQGSVTAENDLANEISSILASQLRLQGVTS